ncbi:hypothetical protein [Kutzneria buriramensis]|uniref:Uncharacterized protein n=1 Tax=Kutzneria buriramensis TaxID=1045776 RepID=A0A3E0G7L1_9PSEU|nr:hypothetical protein [Kutzneria buriramensis]REH18048.1 hypothetical protein BCF44_13835 [Kutzneria buriramensis]
MTGHDDVEATESHTTRAVDQVDAIHWHGYTLVAAAQTVPTPADRAIRLAAEPETVLTSPDAVGTWVAKQIRSHGDRAELWISSTGQWTNQVNSDSTPGWPTLETECALRAAQARSVYAAAWTAHATSRFEVFAEAVTARECPVQGDHLDGRRQR